MALSRPEVAIAHWYSSLGAARLDYDVTNIPASYDKARSLSDETLNAWMAKVSECVGARAPSLILDLGCGTGRFTHALAKKLSSSAVGVDPSQKMLAEALAKPNDASVRYVSGSAESIPLPNSSVDLVFISMVFHHFTDPGRAARECRRVSAVSGRVFVRTAMIERIDAYAYIDFFPTAVPLLQRHLPTRALIRDVFEAASFRFLDEGLLTQIVAPNHAAYADRLAAGGDSILAQLAESEFHRGLDALRAYAASNPPRPITEPIDYLLFEATETEASQRLGFQLRGIRLRGEASGGKAAGVVLSTPAALKVSSGPPASCKPEFCSAVSVALVRRAPKPEDIAPADQVHRAVREQEDVQ